MTNLTATPSWDNVLQLETTTRAKGGVGGVMNLQAQALLNRIELLKQDTSANRNVVTNIVVEPEGPGAGELVIDYELGDYFTADYSGNITSFVITNLPASPKAITLMINLNTTSSGLTIAWPTNFNWPNAVIPTPVGNDLLAITSFDQGTTWLASLGKDFRVPA